MIGKYILGCSIFFVATAAQAQYFNFSQYNYATQRVNPAIVATSNYANASFLYRNQAAAGDIALNSTVISASYPMLTRNTGQRWAGIGASLMDDRSGNIFSMQEASLSYAVNVFLARYQTISLGFKGLYLQRKVNLDGLYTGSQYIPDRGFDQAIFNGENISILRSSFFTFSSGLYWQHTDRDGAKLAYWGISLFDFNKPDDSFSGVKNELNSTFVFTGGVRLYEEKQLSIMPEVLFTRSAARNVANVGAVISYYLQRTTNQGVPRVDIITKYIVGRSGIAGIQIHRENFSVGFSYDFPVLKRNVGNLGAFEVGLELRRLVDPRTRKAALAKKKKQVNDRKTVAKKPDPKAPVIAPTKIILTSAQDTSKAVEQKPEALKVTLRHKQDSALASAEAGKIKHAPLVLEKITLHFNFEFNSSDLDQTTMTYLDDLIEALTENEHLKIKLTGHTDNIGSAKFNHRLSVYRAEVIKSYLTGKGILPERIQTDGKGLTQPLNDNSTEEDRAKNRRVELEVLYE